MGRGVSKVPGDGCSLLKLEEGRCKVGLEVGPCLGGTRFALPLLTWILEGPCLMDNVKGGGEDLLKGVGDPSRLSEVLGGFQALEVDFDGLGGVERL